MHSTLWRDQEKNATGCISLLAVVIDRILAIAKSEASVSTIIGRSGAQWQRTSAEVNTTFRAQKASHSAVSNNQGVFFLQRLVRGLVSSVYP